MWPAVRAVLRRYRELILAATFLGAAGYEAAEMWVLEGPRAHSVPLGMLIHSLQVGLILAATAVTIRAWRRKTAHEEALSRLVGRVVSAQEEERRRIAYELHDGISPLVVSAKQHLDTCRDLWSVDAARAEAQLGIGIERLRSAIVETRRVLGALRPSALVSAGLGPAARQSLEETAGETGWVTTFTDNLGDERLPPVVETAAFRILQEALANVRKHARTPRVDVELKRADGWLEVDVRDYGIGLPEEDGRDRSGLGLLSMRERAQLVGGSCAVERASGRGLRVRARLPLPARP